MAAHEFIFTKVLSWLLFLLVLLLKSGHIRRSACLHTYVHSCIRKSAGFQHLFGWLALVSILNRDDGFTHTPNCLTEPPDCLGDDRYVRSYILVKRGGAQKHARAYAGGSILDHRCLSIFSPASTLGTFQCLWSRGSQVETTTRIININLATIEQ